jgi:spectinomycin phosphotransferase
VEFIERVANESFTDPVGAEMAGFLTSKSETILDLIRRTEELSIKLLTDPPPFVVCHSDLHAGNILIDANGELYIVDWDAPIRAPKERDLMYPGGGQGFRGHTAQQEVDLFFEGYGQTDVNQTALAYYRCERIIEDIAVECAHILSSDEGGENRVQELHWLKSNFVPEGVIDIALQNEKSSG